MSGAGCKDEGFRFLVSGFVDETYIRVLGFGLLFSRLVLCFW